jgi:hypothetical protein
MNKLTEERLQAVEDLCQCDHGFLTVEGAERFSKPFGLKPRTYVAYSNPTDPKGLTLDDGVKSARGVGAHELAMQICDHLGVKYPVKFGRGSQLRECCSALEQWIQEAK